MKTRDITLSSSLMGLWVAIILIQSSLPVNITTFTISALFGLFWNYFSTRQNLAFQGVRLSYTMIISIRQLPQLTAIMRGQSFAGLAFLDWVYSILGVSFHNEGYQILEATLQAQPTGILFIIFFVYAAARFLIMPYAFYRIFKRMGVFKRIPVF